MFALIAAGLFLLATFNVHLGSLNLVALGLVFVAAHWVLGSVGAGGAWPWHRRE